MKNIIFVRIELTENFIYMPFLLWCTDIFLSSSVFLKIKIKRNMIHYMVTPFHVIFILKGQFWNIPVSAAKLTDPTLLAQLPQPDYNHSNLYMITVQPADSLNRTFFGELFGNHWDSYKSPCLCAGNSQVRFLTH